MGSARACEVLGDKEAFGNQAPTARSSSRLRRLIRGAISKLDLGTKAIPEAPAAPARKGVLAHWVNADTGERFDVNTSQEVYPVSKVPTS